MINLCITAFQIFKNMQLNQGVKRRLNNWTKLRPTTLAMGWFQF